MSGITSMFASGVTGWDTYAPSGNRRQDDQAAHQMMSSAKLAVPEPLVVTGTTSGTGTWPVEIAVVGIDVTAQIVSDHENTYIDVYPNSRLQHIRIDSARLTTSNTMDVRGNGNTEFTLIFDWGSAEVNKYHGSNDEREGMLSEFLVRLGGIAR